MAQHSPYQPSQSRINQNIYYRAPRRFITNDRINARGSRISTNYYGSESTPSRPGGTHAQTIISNESSRRHHKLSVSKGSQDTDRTPSYYDSQAEEDLEWVDKILTTSRTRKLAPKPTGIHTPKRPKSILKQRRHLSSSLLRTKHSSRRETSTSLTPWTEESREQFVHSLTQGSSKQLAARKKIYFTKYSGIRDTDILGLEIPTFENTASDFDETDEDVPKVRNRKKVIITHR